MIKVGILSMQRIANYGSFLQAYGLKNIFEELGCQVQFVDYHPGETLISADGGTGLKRKVFKVMEVFSYNAPLREKIRFIKYKKNYASNYYHYLGINNQMNYCPELDLLVIGSDEVFNCVQNNTNVGFSPELFGDGNRAKRLISYAASFGSTTIEIMRKYNVEKKVALWLEKFDAISVRDNNSGYIVEQLTENKPQYNLDPVISFDFLSKCKDIPQKLSDDQYLILYGYAGRFTKNECKQIIAFAKKKSLKIYCIGGVQDCCDQFIDCNPFEVISYFQNSSYVITDTFHGSILSIITHRNFVTFIRKNGYGNSQKLIDLLDRLNLISREIRDCSEMEDILSRNIDYEKTDQIIEEGRNDSYKYLREEIEKCIQN